MKTTSLNSIRIKFLKIISSINLVASILVLIRFNIIGRDVEIIHYFLIVSSFITLLAIKRFPKSTLIAKINPIATMWLYAYSNCAFIMQHGEVLTYPFFLFPLFASFLLGSLGGFTLSLFHLLIPLAFFGFNPRVFGDMGEAFISIYMIQIVTILFFERVHDFLLAHIRRVSSTDALTGLANTSGFMYNLTQETTTKGSFYLILTDFDYFSRINTNLGYTMCDKILKRGGEILNDSKQVTHIARYYGDQFSIIFEGNREELCQYITERQKLIRNISQEFNIDVKISISSGIIHYPGDCESVENLMSRVELALKEAKKSDREAYEFFNSESLKEQRDQQLIQNTLPGALQSDEIEVHFQPKVSVGKKSVSGMEALIRWNHPELGYLAPPVFIEIAEKNGLIVDIGEFVVRKSFEHLARCNSEGFTDISISINISPIHLLTKDFLEKLLVEAERYSILPEKVYIEITENLMLEGDVTTHLEKIQAAGFKLSLDDFGTGYSSLNYLREFTFDELKIDKCFTDGLMVNDKEIQMFGTILSIAKIFKMKTVIEGVEEPQQVSMIEQMGVDEIQGWHYSKALPTDQFMSFISKF